MVLNYTRILVIEVCLLPLYTIWLRRVQILWLTLRVCNKIELSVGEGGCVGNTSKVETFPSKVSCVFFMLLLAVRSGLQQWLLLWLCTVSIQSAGLWQSDTETKECERSCLQPQLCLSESLGSCLYTVTFVSFLHSGGQLRGGCVVRRHGRPCRGSSYLVRIWPLCVTLPKSVDAGIGNLEVGSRHPKA